MGRKRKYEEVVGYWVYSIKVPSIGKFYIGISKQQCSHRWQKVLYVGMALEQYLDEWDSMEKTVLVDNLTKEQAYQYEDNIIRALQMNNLCINERRSGLIKVNNIKAYQRERYKNNSEYYKQYREDNKERERERAKQYYENNKEQINEKRRQRNQKKKIEKQNQQLNLFS